MAYPRMTADEKMDLCRLMVQKKKTKKERRVLYEGLQRAWRSIEKDEAMLFLCSLYIFKISFFRQWKWRD